METRIIKDGKTPTGYQNYALVANGKKVKYSMHYEKLEALEKIIQETGKVPPKSKHHETMVKEARVIKMGFWNGKQRYALRHEGKNLECSIHKEQLQKKADEINKEVC